MKTPTLEEWSLTVERGLTQNLVLQVGYVGSEAYHVVALLNRNMAPPQTCSDPKAASAVEFARQTRRFVLRKERGTCHPLRR